ncbi:MAG: hypothetical protein M1839_002078 [Geoglossum umbratile]|nr:MAG: hypothetical protein M1839_002078 [Geoglossum umbratile]
MVIQENDTDGIISNPYETMRGTLLDATRPLPLAINTGAATPTTDSDDGVVFTPGSTSTGNDLLSPGALTPTSGYSSALSISSPPSLSRNRCPLCPPSRPPFSNQKSRQQHLSSPAHTPRLFHCPISLLPNPPSSESSPTVILKSFSTLSGLAQHLESGACEGGTETFRRAAKYIEIRLKEMGVTTVKLLK